MIPDKDCVAGEFVDHIGLKTVLANPTLSLYSICVLVAVFSVQALGQGASSGTSVATNIDDGGGLIKLDVVVTDNAGKPVVGLGPADFQLLDNSQPEQIRTVQTSGGPDPAVEVILLIDTLEMPEELARLERVAVDEFLRQKGGHLPYELTVFELSNAGFGVVARSSRDGNELASDIDHDREIMLRRAMPHTAGEFAKGYTSHPPLWAGAQALGQIATEERQKPGRKVLLWVGPGTGIGTGKEEKNPPISPGQLRFEPGTGTGALKLNEGIQNRQELLDMADWFSTLLREARIVLYTFSIGDVDGRPPLNAGHGGSEIRSTFWQNFLDGATTAQQASWMHVYKKVLAVQSGGDAFEPSGDLTARMNHCVEQSSTFYTLSFDPPLAEHANEYHGLQVRIGQAGLTAHTNTGYYDQLYYRDRLNPDERLMTVEQLSALFAAEHGKGDAMTSRAFADAALTERLNAEKLSAWMAESRGEKARHVLAALADASAFLDPPRGEVPAVDTPEPAAQSQMLVRAKDYLEAAIPRLPNIFATRTAVRYEEPVQGSAWLNSQAPRWVDSTQAMVTYRQGNERIEVGPQKSSKKPKAGDPSLTVNGTFGPLLTVAEEILAVPESLRWSRWGQRPDGRVAVFRYDIPAEKLSYRAGGCCLPDGDGKSAFPFPAGYRGEIEIDADSGALLRLELEADLKSTTPLMRSDVMIEYGPVEIGGKTYICPLRSVSISRVRSVNFFRWWDEGFRTYGPYSTLLNDITFSGFHIFRSQSHIVSNSGPEQP